MAVITALSVVLVGCGYDDNSTDVTKVDVDKYVTINGDYHNLELSVNLSDPVEDDDVDRYIEYDLGNHAETVKSDKTVVENGDVANIDYEGLKDGVAFDGGTAQGYDLAIGSGTFIPGFEEGLIGHSVGEEVALNVTFPENYQSEELAGQPVVFNVKINYISEKKNPELNDEYVASLGLENVTNVEEYKAYTKDYLIKNIEGIDTSSKRDAAQNALIGLCTFKDVSGLGLHRFYKDQLRAQVQKNAERYNMSVDEAISAMYGTDAEGFEQQITEQATTLTQGALACGKVARLEKISISDEEFNEQVAKDSAEYGYASVDEFKKYINPDDYRNYLLQMKVVDKILETAVVTDSEPSDSTGAGDAAAGAEAADTTE